MDSYKLALIGLYFVNRGMVSQATDVINELISRQDPNTGEVKITETSIIRSYGSSLAVETTALTMILILRVDANAYSDALNLCVKFIVDNLKDGYFGSTQATILSLYAFTLYLENNMSSDNETLSFDVNLNNNIIGQMQVNPADILGGSKCQNFTTQLATIENPDTDINIRVSPNADSLSSSNSRYMFSINLKYVALLPNSVANSPLEVTLTKTLTDNINLYDIVVRNNDDKEHGMLIYDFYKPSCYDFNINDLETMRLRGDIDSYELKDYNSRIVFYFRGIGTNQVRRFSVSLYKRFSLNDCEERAHEIYLYYDREGSVVYARA